MPTLPENKIAWRRIAAGIIDLVVILGLLAIDIAWFARVPDSANRMGWFALLGFTGTAYSPVCHSLFGQTLGKRIARIRVTTIDGGPLSGMRSAVRDIGPLFALSVVIVIRISTTAYVVNPLSPEHTKLASALTLFLDDAQIFWIPIELITMLANSRRRSLQDVIAGTIVVRDKVEAQAAPN